MAAYQVVFSSNLDGAGSTAEYWVAERDLRQLDEQVPQDILLGLDGEPLVVGVGVEE